MLSRAMRDGLLQTVTMIERQDGITSRARGDARRERQSERRVEFSYEDD